MKSQAETRDAQHAPSLAMACQVVAVLLVTEVAAGVLLTLSLPSPVGHEDAWIIAGGVSDLVAQSSAVAFAVARGVRFSETMTLSLNLRGEIPRTILGVSLLAVAALMSMNLADLERGSELEPVSVIAHFVDLTSTLLLAPFFEELLFRGVLLRALLGRFAHIPALVYGALIFGVLHPSVVGAISALVLGLVLGFLFLRTNSIWICALGHLSWNTTVMVLGATGSVFNPTSGSGPSEIAVVVAVASLILAAIVLCWSDLLSLVSSRGERS